MTRLESRRTAPRKSPLAKIPTVHLELYKSPSDAKTVIEGVLGIDEFSPERVSVRSHGGRLFISGESLTLSTLENRTLQVSGKIYAVEMKYGKA